MTPNTPSERIALLRPILIFLILTCHVPGNLYRPDLKHLTFSFDSYLHVLLSGIVAVGALPLLSIISGYLALSTWKKYSYGSILLTKSRRLLWPMVFWNLIMVFYIFWLQSQGISPRPDMPLYPFSFLEWMQGLLGLTKIPANPPLYFLRELMLCFLLLPILVQVARYGFITFLLLALISWMAIRGINLGFIHRVDIYGFFLLGLYLAQNRERLAGIIQWFSRPGVQTLYIGGFVVCALLFAGYVFLPSHKHFFLASKFSTLLIPLVFWMVSGYIGGWLKKFLLWLSPVSFAVFLGHGVILPLTQKYWPILFGHNPLHHNYLVFWLTCIGLSFVVMAGLLFVYRSLRNRLMQKSTA